MAITKIQIKNGKMHDQATISFTKGNIATIVGLNGHGKSQLLSSIMDHSSATFKDDSVKTTVSFEFSMDKESKDLYKNFAIFHDKSFGIKPDESLEKEEWVAALSHLNYQIIRFIEAKSREAVEKHGEAAKQADKDFRESINEEMFIWSWLPKSLHISPYLKSEFSNNETLVKTMDQMAQWYRRMNQLIKVKGVNPNAEYKKEGFVYFKGDDEGINPAKTISNGTAWVLNIFYSLGMKALFKSYKNFDTPEKLFAISTEASKRMNALLNQAKLEMRILLKEFDKSNHTLVFSTSFVEGVNEVPWEGLSTGTKKFLQIFSQLGNLDENTIVCIDEPDTSLHPTLQTELREIFESTVDETKCYFIITTHSVFMLNGLSNRHNTYVSDKISESKSRLSNITNFHDNVHHVTSTQIWDMLGYMQLNEKNFSSRDKLILVDSDSDAIYLKMICKLFNVEMNSFKIMAVNGDSKIPMRYLHFTHIEGIEKDRIMAVFNGSIKHKDKANILKWADEIKMHYSILDFENIEDVFVGKDKEKYEIARGDLNVQKLKKAYQFSMIADLTDLDEKTLVNIDKIAKMVEKMCAKKK